MATYFKFDKKLPHINYDDIYVKSGKIENGKLVLSYSNEALDPIDIDLSAFNNFAYFDSVKLEGNSLIFSYFEKSGKKPVSIDLSAFDHYIETVRATDAESRLQNSINKLSNIFIFDEDGDVVAFKMKDSTVPDLNWKVSIEGGQLTISEHVEFLSVDNIYADNAYVSKLSVS